MMKGILAIAKMHAEVESLKPATLKRVDEIFQVILNQFDIDDFAEEVAGGTFLTFLMGTHLNQYIITYAMIDEEAGDIYLTGFNTNTRKLSKFWLSKNPIYHFSLSVSDDAVLFFEDTELYITKKPKRGDIVVNLKDLHDHYYVSYVDSDMDKIEAINFKHQYRRRKSDAREWIVLNREPIKLMYEVTEKIPNEQETVTTYFDYKLDIALPLIEGAERTIRVIKVK